MSAAARHKPLALVILDGWGVSEHPEGNAVRQSVTPTLNRLLADCPKTFLGASGTDVGLPQGQMGNSEVGHLNIGAGRVIYQDLTRISLSIEQGEFFSNPVFAQAMDETKSRGGKLHLVGLLSDGGVHSHNTHLYSLVQMARDRGVQDVCIHAILDGRDTPPSSAAGYLGQLEDKLAELGAGRVATVIGRYYAMDRDNRWDRVERAYKAMTQGVGIEASSSAVAIEGAYAQGQTDEFVEPRIVHSPDAGVPTVADGDGVIFFNYRSDRAREITRAFTEEAFSGFDRTRRLDLAAYVCMTEYDETFDLPVAFPSEAPRQILGEVLSRNGLSQLRIAETEKYAHVTFFFNGGIEEPFEGEDRVLIPSPKDVATYDQKPAMSAVEVTDEVVQRIAQGTYDVIILNYANPDMVGHTGVVSAAVEAMETVDRCVQRVEEAVLAQGGLMLVTSDHGNCEQMADESGKPHTAHTSNPVPFVLVGAPERRLGAGILADIAPTMLDLLGLEKPSVMTGRSLLEG